jgi:hypothetical protein
MINKIYYENVYEILNAILGMSCVAMQYYYSRRRMTHRTAHDARDSFVDKQMNGINPNFNE